MAEQIDKMKEAYSAVALSSGSTAGAYRQVKTSAGKLYGWHVRNLNSTSGVQVKFYNSTAPAVTTDTPVLSVSIPSVSATDGGPVDFRIIPQGINFSSGISVLPTTSISHTKKTTIGEFRTVMNVFYK